MTLLKARGFKEHYGKTMGLETRMLSSLRKLKSHSVNASPSEEALDLTKEGAVKDGAYFC